MRILLLFSLLSLVFILTSHPLMGQRALGVEDEIKGFWTGILTQNEGGYADQFELTFNLEVHSGTVTGTAFVALGEIEAEMAIEGRQKRNGSWLLRETRIIRAKQPEYLSWCLKGFELTLTMDRTGELVLRGPWWGSTQFGPCVPGSITLRRPRDRA